METELAVTGTRRTSHGVHTCGRFRHCGLAGLWLALLSAAPSGLAQSQPLVLQTGSGVILTTALHPLANTTSPGGTRIDFEFGFASNETPEPSSFADSFTVSLENPLGQRVYIATVDASGTLWAPGVPGSIPIQADDIQHVGIRYALETPAGAQTIAYSVSLRMPTLLQGEPLQLRLDLFDNLNTTPSQGYLHGAVVVPEPTVVWLGGLGAIASLLAYRRRCSK